MNDWKESSSKRRDARYIKNSDEHRKESSIKKKNTKRWCKGRVGKEHTVVCMTYAEAKLAGAIMVRHNLFNASDSLGSVLVGSTAEV